MSLAEKLAQLTTPDPGFPDPEKDPDDLTAAKVLSISLDSDFLTFFRITIWTMESLFWYKSLNINGRVFIFLMSEQITCLNPT